MNRRKFINAAAGAVAGTTCAILSGDATSATISPSGRKATNGQAETPFRPNPIGVSTYSFWRFRNDTKLTMTECIDWAARMGFDGVELLQVQMQDQSDAYLNKIKRHALLNGMPLIGMSTHQGFVSPDEDRRKNNIAKTIDSIEKAYKLGIPTIRINTGRWGTTRSFDQLMADKGIEKRLEGFTDDDGFKWVTDSLAECVKRAEKCGVVLGLENHWGLGRTAEGVMRCIRTLNSPWLKATLDTGNFFERRNEQFKMMAPETVLVQAKTYLGGGTWYTIDINYDEIAKIMQQANYRGFISLEFEGKEDFETAIPKSLELLRNAFGKPQT